MDVYVEKKLPEGNIGIKDPIINKIAANWYLFFDFMKDLIDKNKL